MKVLKEYVERLGGGNLVMVASQVGRRSRVRG